MSQKVYTGKNVKIKLGNAEITYASDVHYWMNTGCSCKGNRFSDMFDTTDQLKRVDLFNLLHKLLHGASYVKKDYLNYDDFGGQDSY